MAKIYVSSTYNDLKDCREQVRNAIRKMKHDDVAMEYYVAEDKRPLDRCLEDVASCDLYVGIFAWRYGYIPQDKTMSITELEYRQALQMGKECLIFLLKDDAKWPMNQVEFEKIENIKNLRKELSTNYNIGFFSGADDIQARVYEAILNWQNSKGISTEVKIDWDLYREAIVTRHQFVRLAVIAGARHEKFAQIPLTDVFVPQIVSAGLPNREVPEEVLNQKRKTYAIGRSILEEIIVKSDEGSEGKETKAEEESELIETDIFFENIIEIFGRERKQVFLGGPGSGKSTMLLFAMLELSDRDGPVSLSDSLRHSQPIPFLIELRQYVLPINQNKDFVEYIVDNVKSNYGIEITKEEIKSLLSNDGNALVFFDGLDEVFEPSERSRIVNQFESFSYLYKNANIVVTSRIAGYDASDLVTHEFTHYTVLDFTLQHIRQFVPKWNKYYTWEGDKRGADGLIRQIEQNPRLLDLAGNPLLLTMMAILYKHEPLPEKRWKLYERCTDVLLEDWDIKRKDITLNQILALDYTVTRDQKAEILRNVAKFMLEHGQENRELNAIFYDPLMRILSEYLRNEFNLSSGKAKADAQGILTYLRERTYVLAEIGERIFGFVHRTFMEYFTAGYYKDEFNARQADYNWMMNEVFGKYWHKDEWQEVLLLLIAMLSDQKSPVQEIIDFIWKKCNGDPPMNLAFAAQCLAETGVIENNNKEWAENLVFTLVQKIASTCEWYESKAFSNSAIKACAKLASLVELPESAKKVIRRLESSNKLVRRMVGWQLNFAFLSGSERLSFAIKALNDRKEAVRRGAIAALEREWPGNEQVKHSLIEVVRTDRYVRVRQAALETLQRGWPETIEILGAIEARVDTESSFTYVQWLMNYLTSYWKGNQRAFDLILKLLEPKPKASSDYDHYAVAHTGFQNLLKGWREKPDVYNFLKEAANSNYNFLRAAAIQSLSKGWSRDNHTWDMIVSTALNDRDHFVRYFGVSALEIGSENHKDAVEIIESIALNDTNIDVRTSAIRALGPMSNNKNIREFLAQIATEDQNWNLRCHAITSYFNLPQHLFTFYHQSDEVARSLSDRHKDLNENDSIGFLTNRLNYDESPVVRKYILQILFFYFKDKNIDFFREFSEKDPDVEVRREALRLYAGIPEHYIDSVEYALGETREVWLEIVVNSISNRAFDFIKSRSIQEPDQKLREFLAEIAARIEIKLNS